MCCAAGRRRWGGGGGWFSWSSPAQGKLTASPWVTDWSALGVLQSVDLENNFSLFSPEDPVILREARCGSACAGPEVKELAPSSHPHSIRSVSKPGSVCSQPAYVLLPLTSQTVKLQSWSVKTGSGGEPLMGELVGQGAGRAPATGSLFYQRCWAGAQEVGVSS